jgi:hypothetical protein
MSLTPVHFFSHGSTMMLGEESQSATYWKACGDAAIANGIEHVVMMVRTTCLFPFYLFIMLQNLI